MVGQPYQGNPRYLQVQPLDSIPVEYKLIFRRLDLSSIYSTTTLPYLLFTLPDLSHVHPRLHIDNFEKGDEMKQGQLGSSVLSHITTTTPRCPPPRQMALVADKLRAQHRKAHCLRESNKSTQLRRWRRPNLNTIPMVVMAGPKQLPP